MIASPPWFPSSPRIRSAKSGRISRLSGILTGKCASLILGGIGEAGQAGAKLARFTPSPIAWPARSSAGFAPVRRGCGGFGGAAGLAAFLSENGIELLIDATHPYAAQISRNAAAQAQAVTFRSGPAGVPAWRPQPGDDWRGVADWAGIVAALQSFADRSSPWAWNPAPCGGNPAGAAWLVRCLAQKTAGYATVDLVVRGGSFALEQELVLLRESRVDVLVAKNSGGGAVAAKLAAARQLHVPVVMLERPTLPKAEREFAEIERLAVAITNYQSF